MDRANLDARLTQLAERLRAARRVSVLTGAGVSAASGVPTFRGAGGLWRCITAPRIWRRPTRLPAIRCCCGSGTAGAARRSPAAGPTPRTTCSRAGRNRVTATTIVTQNVDDLHVKAGTARLVRLHGSIWELSCAVRCAKGAAPWRDERVPMPRLPLCPHCEAPARPAVVWFGEALDEGDLRAALNATACDVFLTVGTSSVVYPAAGLVDQARRFGAFTAEINADATPATTLVDLAIQGAAEQVLPEIDRLMHA